jgi:hypothetical protein
LFLRLCIKLFTIEALKYEKNDLRELKVKEWSQRANNEEEWTPALKEA